MAVTDTWATGQSFTAADEDQVARAINGGGWLLPCQWATTGSEAYTISSGNVIQIAGTTLDGGSPAVNDRILVKDAPASSTTGSAFSTEPGNGIYAVTANATNLSLSRVYEMSNVPPIQYFPGGEVVAVQQGVANTGLKFICVTPSNPHASFSYGTNNIKWAPDGYTIGTGLTLSGSTLALSSTSQTNLALAATSLQSAGNVLTVSGSAVQVASMATGTIIYGNAGTPTIGALGGDATLNSSGSLTIGSGAVSLSKLANLSAHSVIGNSTGSSGVPTAVPLSATGGASSVVMTDVNSNLTVNALIAGVQTTATGGGTTTLTVSSKSFQQFTGVSTQTVKLPDATTMAAGQSFTVANRSSGTITVQDNSTATLQAMVSGSQAVFELVSNSTAAGVWDVSYTVSGLTGTVTSVSVATANGFSGSSSGGATPQLTLATTVTGLLKGNGTTVSAAVSGSDYAPATSGTSILKGNGSGGFSNTTSGVDYAPATSGTSALKGNGSGGFSNATLNDVGSPTGSFSMGGFSITSLGAPSSSTDAATKGYVDTLVQGLSAKYSAVAATNTETLTISGGTVTQITGTTVDGQSPNVNDYVLIMNAPAATGAAGGTTLSTQPANGLYQVTANTTNLSVSRASDMTGTIKPDGAYVFVSGGPTWGGGGFVVTTPSGSGSFTYGTNNITFTQFSGAGEISAGTGLSKSGNTLSIENSGVLTVSHGGTGAISITGLVKGNGTGAFTAAVSSSDYAPATSGSSILKGNGTGGFSNATSGSDYAPATSGSSILKGNGAGGFSNATSSSDYAPATSGTSALKANGTGGFANAVLNDVGTATGNYSLGSFKITSLANPTASADATNKIYADSTGLHLNCNWATTGTETFTVSSGTVTQITGTALDGGSPAVNDRILIKDAPSATGTGVVQSNNPGNGIYVVTANTTNLSVSRAGDFSSGGPISSPAGSGVLVSAGSANGGTQWVTVAPTNQNTAFTYGTTAVQWSPWTNTSNVLTRSGNTISVSSMATGTMIFGNAGTPTIGAITGDWAISSSGLTTIGAGAITLAKMASLAANSVIGNTTGSPATPAAVAISSSGAASSVVMTDANSNLFCNNLFEGWATTATGGTTTTLTVSSAQIQKFTGTNTQNVKLPTTGVVTGMSWIVVSSSSSAVTVQASGGATIVVLPGVSSGTVWAELTANATSPTTAAGWDYNFMGSQVASGKLLSISNSLTLAGTDGTTMTFPGTTGTVATLGATQTLTTTTLQQLILSTLTSSASTLTLNNSDSTYVYTGSSTSTWTLPSVSGNTGMQLFLYNRGSAVVTIQRAGADQLYNGATGLVNSISMAAGGSAQLYCDGTYWLVVVASASGGVTKYSNGANPNSTTWTVTHNLGTTAVSWDLYVTSGMTAVNADFASTSTTQCTFTFQTAPTANTLTCVIMG